MKKFSPSIIIRLLVTKTMKYSLIRIKLDSLYLTQFSSHRTDIKYLIWFFFISWVLPTWLIFNQFTCAADAKFDTCCWCCCPAEFVFTLNCSLLFVCPEEALLLLLLLFVLLFWELIGGTVGCLLLLPLEEWESDWLEVLLPLCKRKTIFQLATFLKMILILI